MLVLKMLEDRSLFITKSSNTYQDENNAETIKIILPRSVNGNDLKDCHIYLSFVNQARLGDVCDITEYLKEYTNLRYVIEIPMYQMFTHEPGIIRMWMKILHTPTEMVAKTNEITYTIKSVQDAEGTIPEQEMSIIDGLVTKLDNLDDKVSDIISEQEELVQEGYEVMLVKDSE